MKPNLFVNIIIATKNRSKYLMRCLNSAINQTYPHYDITVVDNNSNDNTTDMLKEKFPDINVILLDRNLGAPGARNIGTLNTMGDILFFIDDDGALEPDVLEIVNDTMVKDSKIASVVCAINENGEWLIRPNESVLKKIIYLPYFLGQCAIRRSAIDSTGLFPEDFIYGAEEIDLSLRFLSKNYYIIFNPKALTYHYKAQIGRFPGQHILKEKNLLSIYIRYSPMPLWIILVIDKSFDFFIECLDKKFFGISLFNKNIKFLVY